MTDDKLPDYWKPDQSKIILTIFPRTGFLYAQVDPSRPDAWMAPKLLKDLKQWAGNLLETRRHVLVFLHDHATLIMPDQPVPMGRMKPGEGFGVKTVYKGGRKTYEVVR